MLRLLLLCVFTAAGLTLGAQDTASKRSCSKPCNKVAATACQAKTTSVAGVTTPAPERAAEVKADPPPVVQPALYKLTSLPQPVANCQPANCKPANCKPTSCQPAKTTTTKTTAKSTATTIALKQE